MNNLNGVEGAGLHFEFITSDPTSPTNRQRIRKQVKRHVRRRKEIHVANALKLVGPLPWEKSKSSASVGIENKERGPPTTATSIIPGTSHWEGPGAEAQEGSGVLAAPVWKKTIQFVPPVASNVSQNNLPQSNGQAVTRSGRVRTFHKEISHHIGWEQVQDSTSNTLVLDQVVARASLREDTRSNPLSIYNIGPSSHDPFSTSTIPSTQTLGSYLNFFATAMWSTQPSKDSDMSFFNNFGSVLAGNEAFIYATGASAAARRASKLRTIGPRQSQSDLEDRVCLMYTTNAIAALRKELLHQREDTASDATIGVIAFLAMFQAVDPGNMALSVTHMTAVDNLVKSRGHHTISWLWYERIIAADLKTACVSNTRPRLQFPRNVEADRFVQRVATSRDSQFATSMMSREVESLLTSECLEIMIDLRNLSLFREFFPRQEVVSGFDTEWLFKHQRLAAEHRLLHHMASQPECRVTAFERCLQLSLLLYINTALWFNFESTCAILRVLATRLRSNILSFEIEPVLYSSLELPLIWMHFVGAYATNNEGERPWYTERLGKLLEIACVESVDALRSVLSRTFYIKEIFDDALSLIFTESIRQSQVYDR